MLCLNTWVVRIEGLEPSTPKLKVSYSSQLSYILIKYRRFMRNHKYPSALVSPLTTMQESVIVRQTYGASEGIRTLNPIGKGFSYYSMLP